MNNRHQVTRILFVLTFWDHEPFSNAKQPIVGEYARVDIAPHRHRYVLELHSFLLCYIFETAAHPENQVSIAIVYSPLLSQSTVQAAL